MADIELPAYPDPPIVGPDPRQTRAQRITENLTAALEGSHVAGANFVTGFHAASVDVGRIQAALEAALHRFDEDALTRQWDAQVVAWIHAVLGRWAQRVKSMRVERRGPALRVEMETQDDLGYYTYGFDVFPQRGAPKGRPKLTLVEPR